MTMSQADGAGDAHDDDDDDGDDGEEDDEEDNDDSMADDYDGVDGNEHFFQIHHVRAGSAALLSHHSESTVTQLALQHGWADIPAGSVALQG